MSFVLLLAACSRPETNDNATYFDLKGYFEQEAFRLQKRNLPVRKKVEINGSTESKTLTITDWTKELAIFADADINKKSWKGSFQVSDTGAELIYSTNNKKIPVKKLVIQKAHNRIKKIEIIVLNKNILFHSSDTLLYYPDSLYSIKKEQKIKFLSAKNYRISGEMK
ncbi:hypothetical protein [Pedobacter sp. MW01-1-1]|uniref:hypothetical protein n=1 Tax=Pedobacter sp. MW01-1-1 TaxID=3383027 RepID=UPI003FEF9ADB